MSTLKVHNHNDAPIELMLEPSGHCFEMPPRSMFDAPLNAPLQFPFLIADDAPKGRATFGDALPSTIIDAGEFSIVSDTFAREGDLERAIACLEEVLEFIPPEEVVPSSCFRAAAGAKLKLEHPGRFANYRIEARIVAYRESLPR